jgi:hypothetical protein
VLLLHGRLLLREEHEEGKHKGKQANSLSQGEAKNCVVEQHLGQIGLTSAGDEEVAENGTDTQTNAGESNSGEASANVVQALNGDSNGGGGADSSHNTGGGSNTADGLGSDTTHHFFFR